MTATLDIGPAREDERSTIVALFAASQARPDRHVCYLSLDPEAIEAEVAELSPDGWHGVLVARRGDTVVGALALEHDSEPPRVWWHGPFVADGEPFEAVADALLSAGADRLPAHVVQQELGPDERHHDLAEVARRRGFVGDPASAVLSRDTDPPPARPMVDDVVVRAFAEPDRDAVAAIHDPAFPDSHVPGHRIDEGPRGRFVLVATDGGRIVGYAAAEQQEDGSGYLDLVGVAPGERGRGVGGLLVAEVVDAARARGCERIHLTVRETNVVARGLYERLGFTEERLIRPYRLGFSMR